MGDIITEKFSILELKNETKDLTLLYVEDEETLRDRAAIYFGKLFKEVTVAADGEEGLDLYSKDKFDIIVTDIRMPKLDGLEMAKKIKEENPDQKIIIVSAYSDAHTFISSILIGIEGYIVKPIDYNQMGTSLYKVAKNLNILKENERYKNNLEKLVKERTEEITLLHQKEIKNYKDTLLALVGLIESRDTYTGGHSQRVATYSSMIAKEMGYSDSDCDKLFEAGILHDIGKIAIPDSVLLKPGKLDDVEYEIIKSHVDIGYKVLSQIPMYEDLAEVIKYHHERFDGSGYPENLRNEQINIFSQIMAVSDAFDAMTTNRIYKSKKEIIDALSELDSLKGESFMPEVVEAALRVLKNVDIKSVISQFPTTKLERERLSYFFKDQITKLFNSNYLDYVLKKNYTEFNYNYLTTIFLSSFEEYNKINGWKKGDFLLQEIAAYLKSIHLDKEDIVFRLHGAEFVLLSENKITIDLENLQSITSKFNVDPIIKDIYLKDNEITSTESLENKLFSDTK